MTDVQKGIRVMRNFLHDNNVVLMGSENLEAKYKAFLKHHGIYPRPPTAEQCQTYNHLAELLGTDKRIYTVVIELPPTKKETDR